MGQAGRPTSHHLLYQLYLRYLLCPALPCAKGLCCLSFRVQCRGNNVYAFESIQRAMGRDQTRAPKFMRSTLPNTDQPRIPNSEYHYTYIGCLYEQIYSTTTSFYSLYHTYLVQDLYGVLVRVNRECITPSRSDRNNACGVFRNLFFLSL